MEGTVRDYEVLDNSNLVVTGSRRQKYHIWLGQPAFGLEWTRGIGFTSSLSQICPGTADLVVSGGLEPAVVPIYSIRQLNDDEYENLLVRFGEKQPEQSKTPPEADIAGAEVEELD